MPFYEKKYLLDSILTFMIASLTLNKGMYASYALRIKFICFAYRGENYRHFTSV